MITGDVTGSVTDMIDPVESGVLTTSDPDNGESGFQADTNQLHAVIGFDQHLGKVGPR